MKQVMFIINSFNKRGGLERVVKLKTDSLSNKYICNHYLKSFGVRIANSIRLLPGETISSEKAVNLLGLPIFVKPNDGGSSFGITKVRDASQLQPAIEKAFAEGREVIMEQFVSGTEVTCGCYKTKAKSVVFPITEVVTSNDFFDFSTPIFIG